jgi:hypothetical protein
VLDPSERSLTGYFDRSPLSIEKDTTCVVPKAERVGFEPTEPFGSRALQARALGQTTQPLHDQMVKLHVLVCKTSVAIIRFDS